MILKCWGLNWLRVVLVSAVLLVLHAASHMVVIPPSPAKPYGSWRDFWPHYLDDHTDVTNQRLHFVGTSVAFVLMLLNPGSFVALGLALSLGFAICPLGRALDTGFVEFGIVLAVFIALAKMFTGKWYPAVAPLVCGYGFAWVGHFYYQQNRPATFIYPTYSLLGDMVMWWQLLTGELPGLRDI